MSCKTNTDGDWGFKFSRQSNVHGLLLRNTAEFNRHTIRSLEAITDNIGTDEVKRGCGNLYRLGLEPQVLGNSKFWFHLQNCTLQWHQEKICYTGGRLLALLDALSPDVPTATYPIYSICFQLSFHYLPLWGLYLACVSVTTGTRYSRPPPPLPNWSWSHMHPPTFVTFITS